MSVVKYLSCVFQCDFNSTLVRYLNGNVEIGIVLESAFHFGKADLFFHT